MNTYSGRVQIDRDLSTQKLETSLFQKLSEIVQPTKPAPQKDTIRSINVEDAIKELIELQKTSQGN